MSNDLQARYDKISQQAAPGSQPAVIPMAASAAEPKRKDKPMEPKEDKSVTATAAQKVEPVDLEAVKAAAAVAGYSDAAQVVRLCSLAGMPDEAARMIEQRLTPAAAAEKLVELQAKAAGTEDPIDSHTMPGDGTKATADNPLLTACQELANASQKGVM